MLKADGFNDCILGVAQLWGRDAPVIVYDAMEVIEVLQERDEMTYDEALEYFEFNIAGAYVGEQTPVFVMRCGIDEIQEISGFSDE